ncbi:hypothetical protein EV361DRAFT_810960 [Lentinula raphanica]|nr:hypothetical protein EV361DRAFT_810960 [Lentinula raphanica]
MSINTSPSGFSAPEVSSVPQSTSSANVSSGVPSADDISVDLTGCPKWLSEAYKALTTESSLQDPLWHKALSDLVTLERYHSFKNPNGNGSTFPSTGRPKAFAWWFQNRKTVTRLPPDDKFGDTAKFSLEWWKWYSIFNPVWRERDASGRIVVNGEGEGEWDEFDRPGQNGMLSLVVSLHWWYHCLDSPSSDWLSALRDISWVLSELVKEKRLVFWSYGIFLCGNHFEQSSSSQQAKQTCI